MPEDTVVGILNHCKSEGIALSSAAHPIKQLENWKNPEELRGVAGGKTVPLLGSVVIELQCLEVGKPITHRCHTIQVRFKICSSGSTDWAPMIIGAKAIDCAERRGLGHVPAPRHHFMGALGIMMERVEDAYLQRQGSVYAIKHSVLDSSDDEDYGILQLSLIHI